MPDSDTTIRIKIGLVSIPREVDVEVDDPESVISEFEKAVEREQPVWWITESDGRRHALVVDKIAYVDVEPDRNRMVGFG